MAGKLGKESFKLFLLFFKDNLLKNFMNHLTDIWRCILLSRNNFSFNLIFILIVTLQLMLVSFRFLKICELNELKKQENRIELFLAQKNIEAKEICYSNGGNEHETGK